MNTRTLLLGAAALTAMTLATASEAATITRLEAFNPFTYFDGNFIAGIDFDDDAYPDPGNQYETQAGFTSVPNSNNKSYSVVNNGITFDIEVSNANLGNQNRWRNATNFLLAGPLLNDFEQWYGDTGTAVEAAITISGLTPGSEYDISSFNYNVGSGQVTHLYYDGANSSAPLLMSFTTSGGQGDYSSWEPGVIITDTADSNGEIVFTIQATVNSSGQSRLTVPGISIAPEPSSLALLGLGGLCMARRRRGC